MRQYSGSTQNLDMAVVEDGLYQTSAGFEANDRFEPHLDIGSEAPPARNQ